MDEYPGGPMSITAEDIAPIRVKRGQPLIWLERLFAVAILAGLGFLLIQAHQFLTALPAFSTPSEFDDIRADMAPLAAQLAVWSLLAPGLVGVLALIAAARYSHPGLIFVGLVILVLLYVRFQSVGGFGAVLDPIGALPAFRFNTGVLDHAPLTFQGPHFVMLSLLIMVVGLAVLYVMRSTSRLLACGLLVALMILPIAAALTYDHPRDGALVCAIVLGTLCVGSVFDRGGRALFVPFVLVVMMAILTIALTYFPLMTATTAALVTPEIFAKIAPIVDNFSLDSRLARNLDLEAAISAPVALAGTYGISAMTATLGMGLTLLMARPGRVNFVLVWIATAVALAATLIAATRSGWELLFGTLYTETGWQGTRDLTDALMRASHLTPTAGLLVLAGLLGLSALLYLVSRAR